MTEPPKQGSNARNTSTPIWHKPGWITAMVGLFSAFLTMPEIAGEYFSTKQAIALAAQETAKVRIDNIGSKQQQEFDVVNTTLAQQGTERIFVMRYLAATLDDPEARRWAAEEVSRLDDLASLQNIIELDRIAFEEQKEELETKIGNGEQNTEVLQGEIDKLSDALAKKDSELSELQLKAGFAKPSGLNVTDEQREAERAATERLWGASNLVCTDVRASLTSRSRIGNRKMADESCRAIVRFSGIAPDFAENPDQFKIQDDDRVTFYAMPFEGEQLWCNCKPLERELADLYLRDPSVERRASRQ